VQERLLQELSKKLCDVKYVLQYYCRLSQHGCNYDVVMLIEFSGGGVEVF
jgi:hypothetical protein